MSAGSQIKSRLPDGIRSAKRRQRIGERNWRSTKSESDWRTFKLLRNKVLFLMNKSRREFYTDFVSNISGDQRKLFAATKKLFNQTADTPFPPHGDKLALANDMGSFFIKKISDLRVSLDATEKLCSTVNRHSSHCSSSFTAFRRVDMDSLRKLVLRAPTKYCLLDAKLELIDTFFYKNIFCKNIGAEMCKILSTF